MYDSAPTTRPWPPKMGFVAAFSCGPFFKEIRMNNKRTRGNKEAKKPKQEPRVTPPAAGGAHAPAQAVWPKPHQVKK